MFSLPKSILLVLGVTVALVDGFSSQISSSFGGRLLVATSSSKIVQNGSTMEMKKGKANVPPQMRGQYKKAQEMAQMRDQMAAASTVGADGLPVFNLYVKSKGGKSGLWYPCGSFKGDERSGALAKSYADGGWLADISKKQLDAGIAGSLAQDVTRLVETVSRAYPALRTSKKEELEFGYRLNYPGLPDEKAKEIIPVEPKEQEQGPLAGLRNIFS